MQAEAHKAAASHRLDEVGVLPDSMANFNALCQIYRREKICIFTGAGVSFTASKYYQTPGWWDLLLEIYSGIFPNLPAQQAVANFSRLRKKYSQPWQMADYLEKAAGSVRLVELLCDILYHRTTKSKYFQTPGWWDLLLEIYSGIFPDLPAQQAVVNFAMLQKKYSQPWQMVAYLEKAAGSVRLAELLCDILYHRTTKKGKPLRPIAADADKRLPIAYLNQAATLNAVIAFCSKIRVIRKYPCYERNERVESILTLNYDCFLEAGATQKYNAARFKPRVSNEPPDRANQLPVYHIHGYIPYGGRKPSRELILTQESYQRAYSRDGTAREIIGEHPGKFSAVFIGVSFNDERLLQLLEELAEDDGARVHFALLKQGVLTQLLKRLEAARVLPILYSSHEQIPAILGAIYLNGLPDNLSVDIETKIDNKIEKVGKVSLSKENYWELLWYNKK